MNQEGRWHRFQGDGRNTRERKKSLGMTAEKSPRQQMYATGLESNQSRLDGRKGLRERGLQDVFEPLENVDRNICGKQLWVSKIYTQEKYQVSSDSREQRKDSARKEAWFAQ